MRWPLIELPPLAEWLHRLNRSGSPSLVEPRFERTVQPQEGVPALPRDRLHPVCFLARGSLWSEINVHRTIRIDQQSLGQTTDGWGLLVGLEHRACLVIVERERPEILGRNIGRHVQPVRFAAVQGVTLCVQKCTGVLRTHTK